MLTVSEKFKVFMFRLGSALQIYSVVLLIAGIVCLLAPVFTFIYVFALIVIAMCTLFLVFLREDFRSHFNDTGKIIEMSVTLQTVGVVLVGSAFVFSVLSFLLSISDKTRTGNQLYKRLPVLIISAICLLLYVYLKFGGGASS